MSSKKTQENSFSHRLRSAMATQHFSQHELASALGTTQSTVSGWLNRGSLPRGDLLRRVAEALQVQEAWLAFGSSATKEEYLSKSEPEIRATQEWITEMEATRSFTPGEADEAMAEAFAVIGRNWPRDWLLGMLVKFTAKAKSSAEQGAKYQKTLSKMLELVMNDDLAGPGKTIAASANPASVVQSSEPPTK
jgi:transcriptional regulator with XRE-family HTH domain